MPKHVEYYIYVDDKYVITRKREERPTDIVIYTYKGNAKTEEFREYVRHLVTTLAYPSDHNNIEIKYINYADIHRDRLDIFIRSIKYELEDRVKYAEEKSLEISRMSVWEFIKYKYFR